MEENDDVLGIWRTHTQCQMYIYVQARTGYIRRHADRRAHLHARVITFCEMEKSCASQLRALNNSARRDGQFHALRGVFRSHT